MAEQLRAQYEVAVSSGTAAAPFAAGFKGTVLDAGKLFGLLSEQPTKRGNGLSSSCKRQVHLKWALYSCIII